MSYPRSVSRPDDEPEISPGSRTSEFWGSISVVVANVLAVLGVLGWVNASEVQPLGQAITAIVVAVQGLVVNGAVVWQYIRSRTELKAAVLQQQTQFRIARMTARPDPVSIARVTAETPPAAGCEKG